MPKVLKVIVAAVIITAAGVAMLLTCWIPYRQGIHKKAVGARLQAIYDRSSGSEPTFNDIVELRRHTAWLSTALRLSPTDALLNVQLAGSYTLLGRNREAIAQLQRTLRYHRRPEIYTALAKAQLIEGAFDDAITSYAHVAAFNPPNLNAMPPAVRGPVRERVRAVYGSDVAGMLP